MRRRLRALLIAPIAAATFAGVSLAGAGVADAALKPCADSNGSALGGSVYLYYGVTNNYCDVTPPQRLHLLRTPSRSACASVGGHGWVSTQRICWDVNY